MQEFYSTKVSDDLSISGFFLFVNINLSFYFLFYGLNNDLALS